ncbi:hypothetical protein Ddye_005186 [Dipteronia dyeriana]|uniref:Histidine kinase/HSP90-like ATPase domain-containing protein n=1 Tax=Dipteronia dyeriana TaxID=168575 RepID=A0AAD9XFZ4_9ROSI|nr:hypothetical protein Ddye_005186 [Dipteronia dyeriana]
MNIIINSLYSNKDIFLRELISNASDAPEKIRFLSLTDKEVLVEGDDTKLEIQIKLDKEKKILSIRDRGIGVTKEDLIKNLGTIVKSGSSAFVEKMQISGDLNLIGSSVLGFTLYISLPTTLKSLANTTMTNRFVEEIFRIYQVPHLYLRYQRG